MKQPRYVKNPVQPMYATEIERRRPAFKVHKALNHAKSAITHHCRSRWNWKMDGSNPAHLGGFWEPPTDQQIQERVDRFWGNMEGDLYQWDAEKEQWIHLPEFSVNVTDEIRALWAVKVERKENQWQKKDMWLVTLERVES